MLPPPPRSPLFPYTTLFRSAQARHEGGEVHALLFRHRGQHRLGHPVAAAPGCPRRCWPRSEEHTSELQSRGHLVCRLLLEKKKTNETSSDLSYPYLMITQNS